MDSDLYRAAISGDINFLRGKKTKVGDQVAHDESSVLHLASLYGRTQCVQEILTMHPSLLCKVNSEGETALHLAAKCGHCLVVRELINESKKSHFPPLPPPPYYQNHDLEPGVGLGLSLKEMMLRVPNVEKDTALHEAARYNRLEVVRLLVEEDPDDSHTLNKAEESPLYLAAYRGFDSIAKVICETCTSPAYRGSDGRTVLHASVISHKSKKEIRQNRARSRGRVKFKVLAASAVMPPTGAGFESEEICEDGASSDERHPFGAMAGSAGSKSEEICEDGASSDGRRMFGAMARSAGSDSEKEICEDGACSYVRRMFIKLAAWREYGEETYEDRPYTDVALGEKYGLLKYFLEREEIEDLIKEVDKHGWTALHYAAYFDYADHAQCLLQVDKSVAYLPDYIKNRTALHIAAGRGNIGTMNEIIEFCPDCCSMVDQRGQNILHIAIELGDKKMIGNILQKCPIIDILLSRKDNDGNTPLHLLATFGCFVPEIIKHGMADKEALNNKNLTPLDTMYCVDEVVADQSTVERELYVGANRTWNLWRVIRGEKEFSRKKEDIERYVSSLKKMGETHMIVAALIATITFAAGFTLPGGFDGNPGPNQGMAILSNKAAFQAFIMTDLIALLFSTASLVIYFVAAMFNRGEGVADLLEKFHFICVLLNVVAIVAMMVAFITGTYVVLAHSLAIAITLCVLGCSFFLFISFIFWKCYNLRPIEVSRSSTEV